MIILVGALLTGVVVGGYLYSFGIGRNVEHARAMALAILCLGSAFLTVSLSHLATTTARIIATVSASSALILIQVPILASLLHLQPLHVNDWLVALISSGFIAAIPQLMRLTRSHEF